MEKEKTSKEISSFKQSEIVDSNQEDRPADIIRRMNPGKFIPTGAELAKILLEKQDKKS